MNATKKTIIVSVFATILFMVAIATAPWATGGEPATTTVTKPATPATSPAAPKTGVGRPTPVKVVTPIHVTTTGSAAQSGQSTAVTTPTQPAASKKGMSATEIADVIFKILGGLVSLLFSILGGLGYMKWAKSERFKTIQRYIDMAFPAVEALAAKTENKVDDKLVEFLKMVNESLKKAGQGELSDTETAAAKDTAAKLALAEKLKA